MAQQHSLQDVLFGEAAVELKLLNSAQVAECFLLQYNDGNTKSLAEIAIDQGYLKRDQVKEVLRHQQLLVRRIQAESSLFGRIAVKLKLLSQDQLAQCISVQQGGDLRRLGEICLERGFLKHDQVQLILQHQQDLCAKMGAEVGLFGQVAIQLKLLTQDQLQECANLQRAEGSLRRIGEVCVERGYLKPDQVTVILKHQATLQQREVGGGHAGGATTTGTAHAPVQPARSAAPMGAQKAPTGGMAAAAVKDKAASPAATTAAPPAEPAKPAAAPAPIQAIASSSGEPRINGYLRTMVQMKASDLHMSSETPAMVRKDGEMVAIEDRPLTESELQGILYNIAPDRIKQEFELNNDADFAHTIEGLARFRANYFRDRKGMGAVFRQIPYQILTPEQLGIPPKVIDLCWLSKGLVLVTGPTGSGKSTTLAALIDYVNTNRSDHIITIEDPIEFVHPNKKCLVNQREVGVHTRSFKSALRAALREDPDIILVGELRDLETISIAVETAETGHLVFGTLHTTTAPSTVDRIIDQFPPEQQSQIRVMLAESLRGVIAQMLCKKKSGGRAAAYEILISNSAVANLIREGKTTQLVSVMQTGKNLGMQTMNDHFLKLVQDGIVEPVEAYVKCNDKQRFKDALDKLGIQLPKEVIASAQH